MAILAQEKHTSDVSNMCIDGYKPRTIKFCYYNMKLKHSYVLSTLHLAFLHVIETINMICA